MQNIVVAPEVLRRINREEAIRLSKLWEDYSEKHNLLMGLITKAGINPKLLSDLITATILLYRN